ncbi:tetratricopeptide repeat protein [Archangium violaceum]|uniref:tetratricopeptide repeat protein n=1 Tax=Archangium violaceum TaxID=83451 RepID=UPI00193BA31B|nr:tetratricopeptide repeat protein [Archangium violaceum]QRK04593.1 tetratricopeptide repeat protein [Archangium violaceum]
MTTESKATASTQEERPLSGPEMIERAMKGFQAYEQGRYEDARAVFVELAAYDPTEGYYRTALGAICLAVDELDDALAHFNEALRLNPTDCPALVNRGEVHLRLGSLLEAAEDFSRVVALDPENKDPLSERARLLAEAARQSAAEEALQDSTDGGTTL